MPKIEPNQLLKALGPLLDKSGGIRDQDAANRITSLMKDASKMPSKCTYLNIIQATAQESVLQKLISSGGWSMLNKWLVEAKDMDNVAFLTELLRIYQLLPVTVDDLKKDNTARFIKGLTKHTSEGIQELSAAVVDRWMKKVKGKSNNENDNDKLKKKKEKERDKDRDKDRERDRGKDRDSGKDRDRGRDRDKEKGIDREKGKEKNNKEEKARTKSSDKKDASGGGKQKLQGSSSGSRKDSGEKKGSSSNGTGSVHRERSSSDSKEDNSENAESRLAADDGKTSLPSSKVNSASKEDDEEKKRKPKTVRVFTNKFRSVFDEDETMPPVKKKNSEEMKPPLSLAKRNSSDGSKGEPPEKIPRLTIKIPPAGSDGTATIVSPAVTSPEVTHGKIKIIPPPKRAHEIHDSSVFMNELTKSSYTHGSMKRKKKPAPVPAKPPPISPPVGVPAIAKTPLVAAPTTPTTPLTPTTPVSPVSAAVQKLPSVPSFYRDTLEDKKEEQESKAERSPPPLEKMDTTEPCETALDDRNLDNSEPPTIEMEKPTQIETDLDTSVRSDEGESKRSSEGMASEEMPDLQAAGDNGEDQSCVPKKNKKRVTWVDDASLNQYYYFELDETERENVNRPKTFNEMKKQEMKAEGKAIECAKRLFNDSMVEVLQWKRPQLIEGIQPPVVAGCNSAEKNIQQQRESGVLQALFFSKQMLPDSPSEPELEVVEPSEIKIIPLVDETSGEEYEHTYNIDPANMPYDPTLDISQNMVSVGNNGNNMRGGSGGLAIQLPSDINNMLASIQQQSIATGGQSLQANSAVMANVQSILASIMNPGPNTNADELINKLRVALEPLKNQISVPMQPMNPNDPQLLGPGPPRHSGILGNAPPGFNMMMGAPPRGFGPPPGPVGPPGPPMMDGGWNMNMPMGHMGPPDMGMPPGPMGPMGPGGPGPWGHMGGPMGPGMPGPRMRNRRPGPGRPVCRHFVTPSGCRYGNNCSFLHPGVNGPPLPN